MVRFVFFVFYFLQRFAHFEPNRNKSFRLKITLSASVFLYLHIFVVSTALKKRDDSVGIFALAHCEDGLFKFICFLIDSQHIRSKKKKNNPLYRNIKHCTELFKSERRTTERFTIFNFIKSLSSSEPFFSFAPSAKAYA